MDGTKLDFDPALNCIIGGRGSGKTTVLEALRFALDSMPDPNIEKHRTKQLESLLRENLGSGSIVLSIETQGGTRYTVERSIGESPLVLSEDGQTVDINIGRGNVFAADIYSQNEIEDIANDHSFQLRLLDRFIRDDLRELEEKIRATSKALTDNSGQLLRLQTDIADLAEAITDLPDVEERLRELEPTGESEESEQLRKAHAENVAREEEAQVLQRLSETLRQADEQISEAHNHFSSTHSSLSRPVKETANVELVRSAVEIVTTSFASAKSSLSDASTLLRDAQEKLAVLREELGAVHTEQKREYKKIQEKSQAHQARDQDRERLVKRRTELLAKKERRDDKVSKLQSVKTKRETLRRDLSELRDARYQSRQTVATRLNEALNPMIRVNIEQFGSPGDYHALLTQAMKGSGLRYANLVDKIVDRIPPAALVELVQNDDTAGLAGEIEVDDERATRVIIQLKNRPELYEIEVVELHDRPILELQDGDTYKQPSALSTGQKCTVILPILLVETDRPLLIDQPEDNLDNAFVFEAIVPSIREMAKRRQLVFVTHNPNIPVLGDASRVFALRSSGSHSTVIRAGDVDTVAPEIISILEGGRAAFEARRERYGKPVPQTNQ